MTQTSSPPEHLAGVLRRAFAWAIDIVPIYLLAVSMRIVDLIELLILLAVYQAAFRSRTPGRWLAGVVIVRGDGTAISALRSLLRTLASLVSIAPMGLGYFWALFDRRHRAFHDHLLDTLPVRAPAGSALSLPRSFLVGLGWLLMLIGNVMTGEPCESKPFEELAARPVETISLPDGKLGMVAYMLTGGDKDEGTWRTTLRRMRTMGVQIVEIGQLAWKDMELEPGRYSWGYAEVVLRINREEKLGLEFVADIGMFINPGLDGVPKLPAHLEGKSFDDPALVESLSQLYEAFFKLPGAEDVKYLFQHFENAEDSLKSRPADRPHVQALLRRSFERAKTLRPDIRTGVCIQSYAKPHWPREMIEYWNLDISTDVIPIISFGPVHFVPEGDDRRTLAEFEAVLQHTRGRPIALNETGHHSSPVADSSPAKQAAFVGQLFALLEKHHRSIEFVTWYEYSDLDPIATFALGIYLSSLIALPMSAGYFSGNMGTCGLLTIDGQAKPAAFAWHVAAKDYYRERVPR